MTPFRIAVIGLPRAGKTTFANLLAKNLAAKRVNGDDLRVESDDWDFTLEGRVRQAHRMREACDKLGGVVVADFVCPTEETRAAFDADITIWMDTVRTSPYPDTNALFTPPMLAHFTINDWGSATVHGVADSIRPLLPHGILIGRFQPFHNGHKALVDAILEREHCCVIAIRQVPRNSRNPLSQLDVSARINEALRDPKYDNRIIIQTLPNITGVYYGRDVGYNVDRIELSEELEAIRATDIRKEMQHG